MANPPPKTATDADQPAPNLPGSRDDAASLAPRIKTWARELGFAHCGVSGVDLASDEVNLLNWLRAGYHGEMGYMARHGTRRSRPSDLLSGTVRVISVRMDYWPGAARDPWAVLGEPERGYVSRYALGRDYHKVLRGRLRGRHRLPGRLVAAFQPN